MASIFSNLVLSTITNLNIDPLKFIKRYGGNLDSNLPAARRIISLNGSRYSFLIYRTGTIILSNFQFSCNLSHLFSWIFSLLHDMILNKVGFIDNLENKIKCKFLVENIACAVKFDFCKSMQDMIKIQKLNICPEDSVKIQRAIKFTRENLDHFLELIRDLDSVKQAMIAENQKFPATIIKIEFLREGSYLDNHKSQASKRRRIVEQNYTPKQKKTKINNLFEIQKSSLLLYSGGTTLITGAQTKPDIYNLFNIFNILLTYVYNDDKI